MWLKLIIWKNNLIIKKKKFIIQICKIYKNLWIKVYLIIIKRTLIEMDKLIISKLKGGCITSDLRKTLIYFRLVEIIFLFHLKSTDFLENFE